jgi:exodeoxyribonuclease VIII
MEQYLAMDALGSSQLSWLATSPKYYQWMRSQPREETEATSLGTAVHTAVLEPEVFEQRYVAEPNPDDVAPNNTNKRATKAYKDAVAALEARTGAIVLKRDTIEKVRAMAAAVHAHPHAAKLLAKAPERELTLLWDRDGRLCRGRADFLGPGVAGDLKTTRSLERFSPFELTRFRYYVQAAWYRDGLSRLDREVQHYFLVAVESVAPYDVGVFALDSDALTFGEMEFEVMCRRLEECEASGEWPGQFPEVQVARVTDQLTAELLGDPEKEVA